MLIIQFPVISPEIFSFEVFGYTLALRWYALAYIAGLVLGGIFISRLVRNSSLWIRVPMQPKQVEDLMTWMIAGVIIGGRLGFVLFYNPGYYMANPVEIVKVWQGGMSFHGGFLGVATGVILYAWRNKLPVLSLGDVVATVTPIGLFFGRLANFIKPELWGRPTDVSWAMIFPDDRALTCPPDWLAVCTRHPSQLYEAALEGLLLGLVLVWLVYRRGWFKHPGRITGVFLLGYGLARGFVEYFREPDERFITTENPLGFVLNAGELGLTMGQVLSLPMILAGVALLYRGRAKK